MLGQALGLTGQQLQEESVAGETGDAWGQADTWDLGLYSPGPQMGATQGGSKSGILVSKITLAPRRCWHAVRPVRRLQILGA